MLGFHFSVAASLAVSLIKTKVFATDDGGPYTFQQGRGPNVMWVDASISGSSMTEVHDVDTGEILTLFPSKQDIEVSTEHCGTAAAWIDLGGES